MRPQHQQQYDKMAPSAPGQKLRVIRLRRRQNESLGFAVRGGNYCWKFVYIDLFCTVKGLTLSMLIGVYIVCMEQIQQAIS